MLKKFNKAEDGTTDLWIITLYASLLEYMNTARVLMTKRISAGDDAIFRSFLEGFVDLKNLISDPDYHKSLLLEFHIAWAKVHKAAKAGNEFFSKIATDVDQAENEIEHDRIIAELRAAGIRKLQVRDKFTKAGLEQEYNAIYAFSSREVHNSFGALMRRHVSENDEGVTLRLNNWSAGRAELRMDAYAAFLIDATNMLGEKFGKNTDELAPLAERLLALRSEAVLNVDDE